MKILKHTYEKKTEQNQNNKTLYIKKTTRKLWKQIVIGGNFLLSAE